MFKGKYKKDNEKITPRQEILSKLAEDMENNINENISFSNKNKSKFKLAILVASILIIIVPTVTAINSSLSGKKDTVVQSEKESKYDSENEVVEDNADESTNKAGIYIPGGQFKMPSPYIQASWTSFFIYEGRQYSEVYPNEEKETVIELRGEKLGTAKDIIEHLTSLNYSEGQLIDFKEVEGIAGTVGNAEIYKVKGYDEKFRLIAYSNNEYGELANIYECLTDINVASGEDVFSKLKLKENIKEASWDTFNNWNYGTPNHKEINDKDILDKFILEMYDATPLLLDSEELRHQFYYKESDYEELQNKQKRLYFKLNDNTTVEIRIYDNGYILYGGLNDVAFKVNDESFNSLWSLLKE